MNNTKNKNIFLLKNFQSSLENNVYNYQIYLDVFLINNKGNITLEKLNDLKDLILCNNIIMIDKNSTEELFINPVKPELIKILLNDILNKKYSISILKNNNKIVMFVGRQIKIQNTEKIFFIEIDTNLLHNSMFLQHNIFLTKKNNSIIQGPDITSNGKIIKYNSIHSNNSNTLYFSPKDYMLVSKKIFNPDIFLNIFIPLFEFQSMKTEIFIIFAILISLFTLIFDILLTNKINKVRIEESERKFRELYDSTPHPVFLIDEKGVIIQQNISFIELFGNNENIIFSQFLKKCSNKEDFLKKLFHFDLILEHNLIFNIQNIKRTFKIYLKKIKLLNEKPVIFCIMHDITDDLKIKDEVSRIYYAMETLPLGVIITNIEGNIIYANPYMKDISGYTVSELKESNTSIFKSGFHNKDFYVDMWSTLLHGDTYIGELVNRRKNHNLYWESIKISSIKDKNSNIKYFVGIKDDISDIKKLQEELTLEKEKAVKLLQYKSVFLTNMSHEIRTPLNSVIGITELLQDTKLDEQQKEYADILLKSSETLLELINNVLDMSKIESGKIELEERDIDLHIFIEDIIDIFYISTLKKGLDLDYYIEPGIPRFLKGDSARLKQVIVNLIGNAIKFTESGKISLDVKIRSKTKDRISILFSVLDTGIGVSLYNIKKIFDPFVQEHVSIRRKYSGTGLGLSISKKIVTLMGGDITVLKNEEKGSNFKFHVNLKINHDKKETYPVYSDNSFFIYSSQDENNSFMISSILKKFSLKNITVSNNKDDLLKNRHDFIIINKKNYNLLKDNINNKKLILIDPSQKVSDEDENIFYTINLPVKISKILKMLDRITGNLSLKENSEINSNRLDLKNKKILIADDYAGNRKLIEFQLKQTETEITFAINGKDALEKFKLKKYDLILMDLQMPEMDGITAIREIIKQEKDNNLTHTPIIIMTAYSEESYSPEVLETEADDFLRKPLKKEVLFNMLKKYIN